MAAEEFDVGARLKMLRLAANFSQRKLAGLAGVPHAQISNIETNRNSPSISTLRKILRGLEISLADFFEPDHPGADGLL